LPPSEARAAWYDPSGQPAPGMGSPPGGGRWTAGPEGVPPQVPPLQPIAELAPRSNPALFARVLIAALVIGLLAVGAIWLIRTLGDGDDNRDNAEAAQTQTRTAEIAAVAAAQGTQTATAAVAASEPTATATVPVPTATAEPEQPTATEPPAEPTEEPEQAAAAPDQGDNQSSSDSGGGGGQSPIGEMLPSQEDVPEGFEQTDDGKLSKAEVAGSFSNSDDAAAKLDEWQWKDNVYRIFELSAEREHAPEDVTYLYVSIHRFGSAEAAGAALPYFAGEVQNARGLAPVETDKQLGDQMIAVAGGAAGTNEVGLYIRDGARVIRVTAFSESGDAVDDALALAEKVLNK
jgi:type II secretory pathway pseudopilin PulG